jgi:catechol 2,3-dioxygenase-like lactoylglutathione lyase family enzyme
VPVELNHIIVPAYDGERSARWFAMLFGCDEPTRFSVFWQVHVDNGVDLDFDTYGDGDGDGGDGDATGRPPFTAGHYAFLVGDGDFDQIFGRLLEAGIAYWSDPGRRRSGEVNHHDGGRGVYFDSPDGHLFEIITRPYGG